MFYLENQQFFQSAMHYMNAVRKTVSKNKLVILVAAIFIFEFSFPQHAARAASAIENPATQNPVEQANEVKRKYKPVVELDEPRPYTRPEPEVAYQTYVQSSAYNSLANQTDGSPFITASGTFTREGVVATNYLPIGTKVRFPDNFGDKVFVVEDRMNKRYWKVVDVWMEDYHDAVQYGRRTVRMEILK